LWFIFLPELERLSPMVSDREKIIGSRLRAFRETLQIARAKFAVAIGFGSERIASIEAGRAPLRYEVFEAVSRRYQLSPYWLAEGAGSPKHYGGFDESQLATEAHPRALFSAVYDKFIGGGLKERQIQSLKKWQDIQTELSKFDAFLELTMGDDVVRDRYRPVVEKQLKAIEALLTKSRADLRLRRAVRSKLQGGENNLLTNVTDCGKCDPVKPPMANLLDRLNKATSQHGMKSKLAKVMGVPLANVSQWLSAVREPGGETTLRLLHWVEQQEQKPNTLGSATNTTKGKTQLRSSRYEKPKSNPQKR
jgi:transcriptional regulator with XRE-family HTH domain